MKRIRISTLWLAGLMFVASASAGPIVLDGPAAPGLAAWGGSDPGRDGCCGVAQPCGFPAISLSEEPAGRLQLFRKADSGGYYGSGGFGGWGYNGSGGDGGDPDGGSNFLPPDGGQDPGGDVGPDDPASAPEPASLWLLAAGLVAMMLLRRRLVRQRAVSRITRTSSGPTGV